MDAANGTIAVATALSLAGTRPGEPALNYHAASGVLASPARYPLAAKCVRAALRQE